MSRLFPDDAHSMKDNCSTEDISPSIQAEITQWLEQLRRSDRTTYNLMALEIWSIAQTMDQLIPGFWSRFMENRQLALQEFIAHRHIQSVDTPPESDLQLDHSTQEENGMMEDET